MTIVFTTNLDWYSQVDWPKLFSVPAVGSEIYTNSVIFCRTNNLPPALEVVKHRYYDNRIEVELWYRKNDIDFADQTRLNHLYRK